MDLGRDEVSTYPAVLRDSMPRHPLRQPPKETL
jgi:hypothetical protein